MCPCLQQLRLNHVGEEAASQLAAGMQQRHCRLKQLTIGNLEASAETQDAFMKALHSCLDLLEKLQVVRSEFDNDLGVRSLASWLRTNTRLEVLQFGLCPASSSQDGEAAYTELLEALSVNDTLLTAYVSMSLPGPASPKLVRALASMLESNHSLTAWVCPGMRLDSFPGVGHRAGPDSTILRALGRNRSIETFRINLLEPQAANAQLLEAAVGNPSLDTLGALGPVLGEATCSATLQVLSEKAPGLLEFPTSAQTDEAYARRIWPPSSHT